MIKDNNLFKNVKLRIVISVVLLLLISVVYFILSRYAYNNFQVILLLVLYISLMIVNLIFTVTPILALLKKQLHIQQSYAHELENHMELAEHLIQKSNKDANIKNEFLSNISHEIRTPMHGIIGMTELLQDTELDETQLEYLHILKKSGGTLLSLIDDMFDFTKMEEGTLELDKVSFNPGFLIEDFASSYAYRAEDKGLELDFFVDDNVPKYIIGDPGRISQILSNLTGNAIKFTSEGGVLIECRVKDFNNGVVYIEFSVTDTGVGVNNSEYDEVFDFFTQSDSSLTKEHAGIGMGLAISRQLTLLMGGEIGVDSVPGKGSRFWVNIPFEKVHFQNNHIFSGDINLANVLYIGSNQTNRDVISHMLINCGVKFIMVENDSKGMKAIKESYLTENPINIVIIDKRIGEYINHDFCKNIRKNETYKNTHLILLTSKTLYRDAKFLEDIGYTAYLTKPLQQIDLYDCIAEIVGLIFNTKYSKKIRIISPYSLHERRNSLN
ncbi:MAG: hypothetical protein JXR64_07480 [Spirochaetales bacterium]|nr:hypothetical protein [Spirochaetales bacterium]